MKLAPLLFAVALSALAFSSCTGTGTGSAHAPVTAATSAPPTVSSFGETASVDPAAVIPYPFTTCAVIRKDLKGKPKYRRVHQNQEVLFCCTPCVRAFDTNPEPYMPRIIEAAAAKARGETVNSGW